MFTDHVYERTPEESYDHLLSHLASLFPAVSSEKLKKFLK
jgi:hypothetical protein